MSLSIGERTVQLYGQKQTWKRRRYRLVMNETVNPEYVIKLFLFCNNDQSRMMLMYVYWHFVLKVLMLYVLVNSLWQQSYGFIIVVIVT